MVSTFMRLEPFLTIHSRQRFQTRRSQDEQRYITIGSALSGRILVVAHTDRGESVRLISARPATPTERRFYEQGQ